MSYCVLDKDMRLECQVFINKVGEAKLLKVFERQKSKFSGLWLKTWVASQTPIAAVSVGTCMTIPVASQIPTTLQTQH